ncbi:SlyX family protein [Aquabacterium humicola]|uniref:SlyX family protein n=1 Tax=Aquabacterium humicola TaxID=3237377 RepID=UPI002543CA6D|nr:SlyX family protein [Rubrivivax pictus]
MDPHDFEQRLTDLEVKATFTEDALDRLNEVVIRQQRQIDLLMRELMELKRQPASDGLDTLRSLRDELPPHY